MDRDLSTYVSAGHLEVCIYIVYHSRIPVSKMSHPNLPHKTKKKQESKEINNSSCAIAKRY